MPRTKRRRREKLNRQRREQPTTHDRLRLAMGHHQAGRLQEAKDIYEQVLRVEPHNPDALQLLGLLASNVGQFDHAEQLMRQSLSYLPNQTAVWSNLGLVLWCRKQFREAEQCCRKAVRLDPRHAMAYVNLGNALKAQGKIAEATAAYQAAIKLNSPLASNNLAILLREQSRTDEEIAAYRRAVELQPDYVDAHKNLGVALVEQDCRQDGIASFQRALELKPDDAETHRFLATARKYREYDSHVEAMERMFTRPDLSEESRMQLGFALGKAYEDLKAYDKSFRCMEEGNRLKRKTFHYATRLTRMLFQAIKAVFSRDLFERCVGSGVEDRTPIFILGMPRSGTSLVEQIIASHHDVHGAGELPDLKRLALNESRKLTQATFPASAEHLTPSDLSALGRIYLDRLRCHTTSARFITDKMPENFQYVGLIKLMLPRAKVIHCRREPLDTCLSLYKTYFSGDVPYAYDQRELGRYYRLYEELMAHWQEMLPGFMCDIHYEELVADQEAQSRRLLEFCGLEWDDACLAFHKTDRAVKTASTVQVRQPIYQTSVQAWKNYQEHLMPLIQELGMA